MEVLFLFLLIIVFLFSVIIHEVSHGFMANYLGDPTPRLAGRLSLNPLAHLDPIGSFLVPLMLIIFQTGFVFGWAKPVPVNPYNFRDQKYGQLKVGIAGISANFLLAIIFGFLLRILPTGNFFFENLSQVFSLICRVNLLLAIFNLFPLPPFDGFHIFFSASPRLEYKISSISGIQFISFFLAIAFMIYAGFHIVNWLFVIITGGKIIF